jgi:hypothetical protein
MEFIFDRIAGMRSNETQEMVEVVRPCVVRGIPVVDGATGSDPEALFKMRLDPQCPARGSLYPTTILPYARATLQEYAIRSWLNPTSAIVDLIYRAKATLPGGAGVASNWSLSRSPQISHLQTHLTAGGANVITSWYKAGTAAGTSTKPAGADSYSPPIATMRVDSVLSARALLSGPDWNAFKVDIRSIEGYINSQPWGSSPRGTWFFVAPTTQTQDYGQTYSVQVDFLENKRGWYGLGVFFDGTGKHPDDSDVETSFPAAFPGEGFVQKLNGLTRASTYPEVDFNLGFRFTPDDA